MPNNWKTYKLKEVAVLSTGFAFKSKFYEEKGALKVIRGKNVTEGYLRWGGDARFWNHEVEEKLKKHLLKLDDIVIGMDGSKVGKNRAIVREHDLPAILAQRVARVQNIDKLTDQKYLWQIIKSIPFEKYVDNVKTGTSIPHISLGQIGDFEINLPPLRTQKQIASILSALDDKIELNLQMNKTLEDMAMALYKHWFVDFGPFQNGEFLNSELGKIPKGWEVKVLDDLLADIIDHRGKTPKKLKSEWAEDDINNFQAISAKNIKRNGIVKRGTIRFVDSELYTKWMKKPLEYGDIIMTSEAPLGETYLILEKTDYCLSQRLFGIRADEKKISPFILFCYMNSLEGQHLIQSRGSGSTVQGIKQSELRKVPVLVAPHDIQVNISNQLKNWYTKIRQNDSENLTLTKTRDTLLPKLISGEIQVKDLEKLLN